jgi:hypothetical protein
MISLDKNILFYGIISGIIAVIVDIIIRQIFIQNIIEKDYLPKECVKYRKTKIHFISIFLVGFIMYFIFSLFHLNKKYIV